MQNWWSKFSTPVKCISSSLKAGSSASSNILRDSLGGKSFGNALMAGARRQMLPGLAGMALGAGAGYANSDRSPVLGAMTGGLLGGAAGVAGGMAYRNRAGMQQLGRAFAKTSMSALGR